MVPGVEEIWRLLIYLVISIFYICFWLGISILFSILFRSIATSALASVALWIFLSFSGPSGCERGGQHVAFLSTRKEAASAEARCAKCRHPGSGVSLFSPMTLYSSASGTIIDPMRKTTRSLVLMGPMEELSSSPVSEPPIPGAERARGLPAHGGPDRHQPHLLRHLLHGVHGAGDPDLEVCECKGFHGRVDS